MICTIASLLHNSGASTLSTVAATSNRFAKDKLLVDATETYGLSNWAERRRARGFSCPTVYTCTGEQLIREIPYFQEHFETIVIDAGGTSLENIQAAMSVSDRCVIPTTLTKFAFRAVAPLIEGTAVVRAANPRLKLAVCENRITSRSTDRAAELSSLLNSLGVPALQSCMHDAPAVARSFAEGRYPSNYSQWGCVRLQALNIAVEIERMHYREVPLFPRPVAAPMQDQSIQSAEEIDKWFDALCA